mgnify:FL=1
MPNTSEDDPRFEYFQKACKVSIFIFGAHLTSIYSQTLPY